MKKIVVGRKKGLDETTNNLVVFNFHLLHKKHVSRLTNVVFGE